MHAHDDQPQVRHRPGGITERIWSDGCTIAEHVIYPPERSSLTIQPAIAVLGVDEPDHEAQADR